MSTTQPITVFVCGPRLCAEQLSHLVAREGSICWEAGRSPAPQPREPIRAAQHVYVEGLERLLVLVTDAGLYLTTVDDLLEQSLGWAAERGAACGQRARSESE